MKPNPQPCTRRHFLSATATGLLALAVSRLRSGGATPGLRGLAPGGMLIGECPLPGETRADRVVPAHPNGLQLARDRFLVPYATRGFRGTDDDRSVLDMIKALPSTGGRSQTLLHRFNFALDTFPLTDAEFAACGIHSAQMEFEAEWPAAWTF